MPNGRAKKFEVSYLLGAAETVGRIQVYLFSLQDLSNLIGKPINLFDIAFIFLCYLSPRTRPVDDHRLNSRSVGESGQT